MGEISDHRAGEVDALGEDLKGMKDPPSPSRGPATLQHALQPLVEACLAGQGGVHTGE